MDNIERIGRRSYREFNEIQPHLPVVFVNYKELQKTWIFSCDKWYRYHCNFASENEENEINVLANVEAHFRSPIPATSEYFGISKTCGGLFPAVIFPKN